MTEIHPSVILTDAVTTAPGGEIGPGVVFAGACTVHEKVRIGAGAVIADNIEIGAGAEIMPGAIVLASVPANAIAQGNPATIVGYRTEDAETARGFVQSAVSGKAAHTPRRTVEKILLGVGEAALYLMPKVPDLRGSLTVGEIERDLPFVPKRYFAIFEVPSEKLRGEHAHRVCEQFLICMHGSCSALVDDGVHRKEVILDSPDVGLYMPPMIWGTQYRYSRDAVLLVFASHGYDNSDYIRDYDSFRALAQGA